MTIRLLNVIVRMLDAVATNTSDFIFFTLEGNHSMDIPSSLIHCRYEV